MIGTDILLLTPELKGRTQLWKRFSSQPTATTSLESVMIKCKRFRAEPCMEMVNTYISSSISRIGWLHLVYFSEAAWGWSFLRFWLRWRKILINKNIIQCKGRSYPVVVRTWMQRASFDDVGCLWEKFSPLFFIEAFFLHWALRLDESFPNAILMTCSRYTPLPFEITGNFLTWNTLNVGNVPAWDDFF